MSFNPAKHGFHFRNSDIEWGVRVGIATPLGMIPLHTVNVDKQLCGGMVYAALDFFNGGRNIPKSTKPPAVGTPLNNYITERQVSAHVGTVHRFAFRFTPRGRYDMAQEAGAEIDKLRAAVAVSPMPMCIVRESSGHHLLALGMTGDKSNLTIKAYDPGVPDVTCTITGNAKSGYVNNANKDSFRGFFVDDSYTRRSPLKIFASDPYTDEESNWRWCSSCQALFFEGGSHNGTCPKGGWHVPAGLKRYVLDRSGGPGESGWKWCHACQGLFWPSGNSTGVCPAGSRRGGGGHDNSDRWIYVIRTSAGSGDTESGWRYCRGCRLLYHGGDTGICPAASGGGPHNRESPTEYFLQYIAAEQ